MKDGRLGAARAGVLKASMDDVDATIGRGLDSGDGGPFHTGGKFPEVAHCAVRLGKILCLRERSRGDRDQ